MRIWVNTVFFSHFPKDRKLRDLPEHQNHKGPLQKTYWQSRTSCRKCWWHDDSRSQNCQWKDVNLEIIIDMQSGCRTWPPNGSSRIRAKQKLQETQRSLQRFLEPNGNPKVIYTDNSLEFGKAGEDLSWSHCTSTPHRSETNWIAERAVRRVKEGTSAVLLQSGLNVKRWADSMECCTYLRNVTDLLSDGKTPYERRFGQPFKGPIIPFGSLVVLLRKNCEGSVSNPSIWKESLTWVVPRIRFVRGGNLEGWRTGCIHWGIGGDGRIWNLRKKTQRKGSNISPKMDNSYFQSQMDE